MVEGPDTSALVDALERAFDAVFEPLIVYVSGPMTTGGNFPVNIRNGIDAAAVIMDKGYVVICPHEKALGMEMLHPRSYDDWMEYDYLCVAAADAVYRMPAPSRGGDLEVAYAAKLGIPVFYSFDTLFAGLTAMESARGLTTSEPDVRLRVDAGNGLQPAAMATCNALSCSRFGLSYDPLSGCPGVFRTTIGRVSEVA